MPRQLQELPRRVSYKIVLTSRTFNLYMGFRKCLSLSRKIVRYKKLQQTAQNNRNAQVMLIVPYIVNDDIHDMLHTLSRQSKELRKPATKKAVTQLM